MLITTPNALVIELWNCTVLTNSDLILDCGDLMQKAGVFEKEKGPENQIAAGLESAETEFQKVWYWHFQIVTGLHNSVLV